MADTNKEWTLICVAPKPVPPATYMISVISRITVRTAAFTSTTGSATVRRRGSYCKMRR
jgi:hypothetical protein